MSTIRQVLAATDFSAPAAHASRRAAQLAAAHGAALTLLHVVEPDGLARLRDWMDSQRDLQGAIVEQAAMELAAHAAQVREQSGVEVRQSLAQGSCQPALQAAAAEADLLVLGARGSSAVRDLVLGTTADRVVRSTRKPVLVVKTQAGAPYRKGVVLTDFSPGAQAALQAALALVPEGSLHLVHAFDVPFEGKLRLAGVGEQDIAACRDKARLDADRQLREAIAQAGGAGRVQPQAVMGDPAVEILRLVGNLQPDFVAVGKRGASLVEDLVLGSTTARVLERAPCDVLVVPAQG